MSIFFSYTLRDGYVTEAELQRFERATRCDTDIYVDILHNPRVNAQAYVLNRLRKSSLVIACITPLFFSSPWTRLEMELASAEGIPIVKLPGNLVFDDPGMLRRLTVSSMPDQLSTRGDPLQRRVARQRRLTRAWI